MNVRSVKKNSAVTTAIACNQRWAQKHIKLRAKHFEEGQRSLHLASGHSVLPVADAMLGMQVLATDKDTKTVKSLLNMVPALLREKAQAADFEGNIQVTEIDVFSDFFQDFKDETFDSITLTDFFKIQLFSYFPHDSLFSTAEYTVFQVLSLLPQRGFLTITEDRQDLYRRPFTLVKILDSFLFSAISYRVIGRDLPTSDGLNDAFMFEITKNDRYESHMEWMKNRFKL